MPKYEKSHKPGQPVSEDIEIIINRYFDPSVKRKLERLGGKITISITTPLQLRKDSKLIIDEEFIKLLRRSSNDAQQLRDSLDKLVIKQLRDVCRLLDRPVSANARAEEIKQEIIKNLQAENFWQGISKSNNEI